MKNNRITRRKGAQLPTPIHRDVYQVLSLGTSLGSYFTKGFVIFAASFGSIDDVESESPAQSPRSVLVGDTSLQLTVDAAQSFIASINNIELVLMKIPQDYMKNRSGYEVDLPAEFPENHPEWVISTKFIGKPSDSSVGQQYQPVVMRSRRRVRLFRGDSLAVVSRGHLSGVSGAITISGVLQCRTRLD
jgi:hypothetical protein